MRLTSELEHVLNEAVRHALDRRHEFVTLEHVLLALTSDDESTEILEACGADVSVLQKRLLEFIEKNCPRLILAEGDTSLPASDWKPTLTLAFHRVIQRAVLQVESSERDRVSSGNLLISILSEEESHASFLLQSQGVNRFDVVNYFSHGLEKEKAEVEELPEDLPAAAPEEEPVKKGKGSPLKSFTVNLNERAKKGLIDPLIGRDEIIDRVMQVLSRRTKNNVLLVGDPGVGKTAIVEGLALRIHQKKAEGRLKDATIYSLDMGSILAGTKFRGDFESRFKGVVAALEDSPNSILFIDEIHTLVGAGATGGGSVDAANLLKPGLQNRTLTCIGSTTYKEYKGYLEKDQALVRRFQKIDVLPPSQEEAVKILEGLKSRYESFHNVEYPSESIRVAVELADRYITGRPLPDTAIDVMDEAGARRRLKAQSHDKITIGVEEIESVVSHISQVPQRSVRANEKEKLRDLEKDLKSTVFGQDKAIEQLVTAIKLSRVGLTKRDKPIGCFLFTGPTGVGKTEVCRQLAKVLGNELIRFDMSEYMEKHTVSRLVGAPPGYVGYDEGGLLTESVSKRPYSVLLFDEMEKAHPDIANILLQVMDTGKLTDTNGKSADFRNVILIMTSNAGARELSKPSIGIKSENTERRAQKAVKELFAPEFLNRLDGVIAFSELPVPVRLQVVDKFIKELCDSLKEKKVQLSVDKKAREWILEKGYDPAYGARPLQRCIDEYVKKPLVDRILFGDLENGGKVQVSVSKHELKFS